MDLQKLIPQNMPYLSYCKHGRKKLDKGGFVGTILVDLSKAYDCSPHDFLVAKLEPYGVDKAALNLISN